MTLMVLVQAGSRPYPERAASGLGGGTRIVRALFVEALFVVAVLAYLGAH
jgi:hypothetical protein